MIQEQVEKNPGGGPSVPKAPKATLGELGVDSPGHPPTQQFMRGVVHRTLFIEHFAWLLNPSSSIMLIYRKQFSHNMPPSPFFFFF